MRADWLLTLRAGRCGGCGEPMPAGVPARRPRNAIGVRCAACAKRTFDEDVPGDLVVPVPVPSLGPRVELPPARVGSLAERVPELRPLLARIQGSGDLVPPFVGHVPPDGDDPMPHATIPTPPPKDVGPTIDVYRETPRALGRCRASACKRSIEWVTAARTGRRMPVDAPLVVVREYVLHARTVTVIASATTHFATCPAASTFSKR